MLFAIAACAPAVDGPAEAQAARDRADERALTAQLGALPGVASAHATVHRSARDPLAGVPPGPSTAAILLVTDAAADRAHVLAAAQTLAHAALPEVAAPTIVVEAGAPKLELADVGPFTVARSSRSLLRATLAVALVAIAGLAFAVAYYRRGTRAQ